MSRAIVAAYAMGMTDGNVVSKISEDEKQAIIDEIGVSTIVHIIGELIPELGCTFELCYQWGVEDAFDYIIEKR